MRAWWPQGLAPEQLEDKGSVAEPLELQHLDAGCQEVLWRVLPGSRVVWQPSHISLALAQRHLEAGWHGEQGSEGTELLETWVGRAKRAELLLIPVNGNGHHWTLLVLERSGGSGEEVPEAVAEPGAPLQIQTLCDRCKRSPEGCLACNQEKRDAHALQKAIEKRQLGVSDWPVLEGGTWEARYYDALGKPSERCQVFAHTLLCVLKKAGMAVTEVLPEPCVQGGQEDSTSCCSWTLFYFEEECRRRRGESSWTQQPELSLRRETVEHILKVLLA